MHCSYVLQHSCWHSSRQSLRSFAGDPGGPWQRGTQSLRHERYRLSFFVPSGFSLMFVGRSGSGRPLTQRVSADALRGRDQG